MICRAIHSAVECAVTLIQTSLLHRIRKGQFDLRGLRLKDESTPAVWNAVLAA